MYEELKKIAGDANVFRDEPMKKHTSFRIGGNADYFVCPENAEQLEELVSFCTGNGAEYFVIGNGTNLLVSDKGYRGVVFQIQKNFQDTDIRDGCVEAGAGVLLVQLSSAVADRSLSGLEFASGIPGTLGGAVTMNAGAYGGEIKDCLKHVVVLKPGTGTEKIDADALELGYRTSVIKHNDWIVLGAGFELAEDRREDIIARISELRDRRTEKQPLDLPSAGSAFKRPEGHFAAKLIMDAGLKGFSVGGACVSEKHSGFIVNTGGATAMDVKRLMDAITERVEDRFNVTLEPEIRLLGEF